MARVFMRKPFVVASFKLLLRLRDKMACLCYDHSCYVCLHMHFKTSQVSSGVIKCIADDLTQTLVLCCSVYVAVKLIFKLVFII